MPYTCPLSSLSISTRARYRHKPCSLHVLSQRVQPTSSQVPCYPLRPPLRRNRQRRPRCRRRCSLRRHRLRHHPRSRPSTRGSHMSHKHSKTSVALKASSNLEEARLLRRFSTSRTRIRPRLPKRRRSTHLLSCSPVRVPRISRNFSRASPANSARALLANSSSSSATTCRRAATRPSRRPARHRRRCRRPFSRRTGVPRSCQHSIKRSALWRGACGTPCNWSKQRNLIHSDVVQFKFIDVWSAAIYYR